jgi:uncharacterized protein (TIGR03435 family)
MLTIVAREIRRMYSLAFAIGLAYVVHAQKGPSPELRFAVASIKPNHAAACDGWWDFRASHGTLVTENAPLRRIISRAYNLTDDRVSGPAWIDSECFDVRAKSSHEVPDRELMPMLQELLKERFHLVARRESGERPILALLVDKGGPKLRPYDDASSGPPSVHDSRILFMARQLPDLCERLGKVTGRPVVDRTGLDGDYQIELTYSPFGSPSVDQADPSSDMVSAARTQLGLRLEAQRGSVEVLKVESVDKVPTRN